MLKLVNKFVLGCETLLEMAMLAIAIFALIFVTIVVVVRKKWRGLDAYLTKGGWPCWRSSTK